MLKQIQDALRRAGIDAALLTSPQNRRYATGFPSSAGVCLITAKGGHLFTDFRYIEAAKKRAGQSFQVDMVRRSYADMVNEVCRQDGVKAVAYEENSMTCAEHMQWEQALEAKMVPMGALLSDLRQVKTQEEIDCCIAAQRIAERALAETLQDIHVGVTEKHIAALLEFRMLDYGGEKMSFDPIVVSGKKSSMPHGVPSDKTIEAGDFVTMDFGCTVGGYCSDMTRTVAVEYATEEMQRVYDIVLRAQEAGIAAAKPGVTGAQVDKAARDVITAAGYGPCFGHSFGHGIGIDIHELPLAAPKYDKPLADGNIISAEPGIYIPDRFGVRIEDMLVITPEGCRDLTNAPKHLTICK
ncbi:MAG: aminopeptidase P family protein [Eubacteriales bacterium]|nr:aminopeptidase P family protein [Eubacteriales bacterium]